MKKKAYPLEYLTSENIVSNPLKQDSNLSFNQYVSEFRENTNTEELPAVIAHLNAILVYKQSKISSRLNLIAVLISIVTLSLTCGALQNNTSYNIFPVQKNQITVNTSSDDTVPCYTVQETGNDRVPTYIIIFFIIFTCVITIGAILFSIQTSPQLVGFSICKEAAQFVYDERKAAKKQKCMPEVVICHRPYRCHRR